MLFHFHGHSSLFLDNPPRHHLHVLLPAPQWCLWHFVLEMRWDKERNLSQQQTFLFSLCGCSSPPSPAALRLPALPCLNPCPPGDFWIKFPIFPPFLSRPNSLWQSHAVLEQGKRHPAVFFGRIQHQNPSILQHMQCCVWSWQSICVLVSRQILSSSVRNGRVQICGDGWDPLPFSPC